MNLSTDPIITRIYGGMFIGNYVAACSETILKKHCMRRIVTVAVGNPRNRKLCESLGIDHLQFPVQDNPFTDENHILLEKIMPWVHAAPQKATLIHCVASISRSPGLVMAYLVWAGKKFEEALALVSLHPVAATPPDVLASFLTAVGADPPPSWYASWSRERLKNSEHIW